MTMTRKFTKGYQIDATFGKLMTISSCDPIRLHTRVILISGKASRASQNTFQDLKVKIAYTVLISISAMSA